MNKEQMYSIISQGLNVANQKGCFNLEESHHISNALITLQKELFPNGMPKSEAPKPTTSRQAKVKKLNSKPNGTNKSK